MGSMHNLSSFSDVNVLERREHLSALTQGRKVRSRKTQREERGAQSPETVSSPFA